MNKMLKKLSYSFLLIGILSCGGPESGAGSDGVGNSEHRIFITSDNIQGNMNTNGVTGITGANLFCQNLADAAQLDRTYKAILSTVLNGSSAADNLVIIGEIFVVDSSGEKTKIALNESTLFDASVTNLLNVVNRDETGAFVSAQDVWSGSNDRGTSGPKSCDNWDSIALGKEGGVGNSGFVNNFWLSNVGGVSEIACDQRLRIYCISQ